MRPVRGNTGGEGASGESQGTAMLRGCRRGWRDGVVVRNVMDMAGCEVEALSPSSFEAPQTSTVSEFSPSESLSQAPNIFRLA